MIDDLNVFPEQLRDTETYPWEVQPAPEVIWPFGSDAGKPLRSFTSLELLRKQRWLLRTNPGRFTPLVEAIELILQSREGE